MKRLITSWLLVFGALLGDAPVFAQDMPDIGFTSVGRGRSLAASVNGRQQVGPAYIRDFAQPPRAGQALELYGFRPDSLPKNYEPLPRDIFTSPDFYADKALWADKRYFRCNSPAATEVQRGIIFPPPLVTTNKTEDGPWGYCDIDYPREAVVSPYAFRSAQDHYDALLAEAKTRGTLKTYTFQNFPAAEWNGQYESPFQGGRNQQNWYWGAHSQVSSVIALLTPEYQRRMVQEAYHQVRGNALWPSTFCWPEGFMRRWYPAAVRDHYIIATPNLVHISTGVARNFTTNIHIARQFNVEDASSGGVPRLGEAVPRWYGETIGFWDSDALITWTSNIQGWKSHSMFEFSNKLQAIEIYTPIREGRKFLGLNHEAIIYDPEALVDPVRIVRNLHKLNEFTDADETPHTFIECVQTIFSVEGHNTPLTPGAVIQYEMPDMYGRPWARIWETYFETGMERPDDADIFTFE